MMTIVARSSFVGAFICLVIALFVPPDQSRMLGLVVAILAIIACISYFVISFKDHKEHDQG